MQARYYDPRVGRFISEDTLGSGDGDVNLFTYVRNNPVNFIDPSGLSLSPPPYNTLPPQRTFLHNLRLALRDSLVFIAGEMVVPPSGLSAGRYDAGGAPTRIEGEWSVNDIKQGLLGHPPDGLGNPDLHHGGQMPGGALHEILPDAHRNNPTLHQNQCNLGITPQMPVGSSTSLVVPGKRTRCRPAST